MRPVMIRHGTVTLAHRQGKASKFVHIKSGKNTNDVLDRDGYTFMSGLKKNANEHLSTNPMQGLEVTTFYWARLYDILRSHLTVYTIK